MVLDPAKEDVAKAVFHKWGLDFAVVGYTTDDLKFRVWHQGQEMAVLPIKELGDQAPLYDRPWVETPKAPVIAAADVPAPASLTGALKTLIGSPDLASKRWVYEQYDHLILGNTVQRPGGDAAVVRLEDGPKGLALTCDVTPRYCEADPFEGGKQAVAEAWRNITAVGGMPLAITHNLNFGNPERPEIMGQLVGCLKGIGAACAALDFPVVSGNVSLYNETQGRGILPTPTIGGVCVVDNVAHTATLAFQADGETVILLGDTQGWLGSSVYLWLIENREEGAPPPIDLAVERRNGDLVRGLIKGGQVSAVHDLSDGGLGVALAEMAMARDVGVAVSALPDGVPAHAALFGEDQARYVVATSEPEAVLAAASEAGVPALAIGTTGGSALTLPGGEAISIADLKQAHEGWFPAYMAGQEN